METKPQKLTFLSRCYVVIVSLAAVGFGLYANFRHIGITKWLTNLQLRAFNSYYPGYTFAVSLVAYLGIGFLVVAFLGATSVIRTESGEPWRVNFPTEANERSRRLNAWMQRWRLTLVVVGMAVVIGFMGIFEFGEGWMAGDKIAMDLSAVTGDVATKPRWVAVGGLPILDLAIAVGKSGRNRMDYYIPVVPADWKPEQPIRLFVKRTGEAVDEELKNHTGPFEGILTFHGVPGIVRAEFETAKVELAPDYGVLDWKQTPAGLMLRGKRLLMGSAVLVFLGFLAYLWQRRKTLKASSQTPGTPVTDPSPKEHSGS